MGNNYGTAIVFIVCIMKCFRNAFDIIAYLSIPPPKSAFCAGIKILTPDQVD
jgi:hypothetical protein